MSMASFWEKIIHFCSEVLEIFPKIFRIPSLRTPSALKNLENAPWEGAWEHRTFSRGHQSLRTPVLWRQGAPSPMLLRIIFALLMLNSWLLADVMKAISSLCPFFHFHTVQQIRNGHCSIILLVLNAKKTSDRGTISVSFLSLLSSSHPYDPLGVSAKYIPPYFISVPFLSLLSFSLASQPLQSHLNTYYSSSIHLISILQPSFILLPFSPL